MTMTSCNNSNIITSPEQVVFPASNVTFSNHVRPFLTVTCSMAGCHHARSQAGGIVLETYFDVVFTTPGLVVIGDPSLSRLAQIVDVTGRVRTNHPISFQARITQNHIDGIKTWIREGAQ